MSIPSTVLVAKFKYSSVTWFTCPLGHIPAAANASSRATSDPSVNSRSSDPSYSSKPVRAGLPTNEEQSLLPANNLKASHKQYDFLFQIIQ